MGRYTDAIRKFLADGAGKTETEFLDANPHFDVRASGFRRAFTRLMEQGEIEQVKTPSGRMGWRLIPRTEPPTQREVQLREVRLADDQIRLFEEE